VNELNSFAKHAKEENVSVESEDIKNGNGVKEDSLMSLSPKKIGTYTGRESNDVEKWYGIRESKNKIQIRNFEDVIYTIVTSPNVFTPTNHVLANFCKGRKLVILVSETIDNLYGKKIREYFIRQFPLDAFFIQRIKTGEKQKNLRNIETICLTAKKFKLDRKGLLIAVGGGVLNDMVGFAASIYKRGIQYIHINTTLVGQIDVAVGIKTAVNFNGTKNFLGSFYPPMAALNDPTFLYTLPIREIRCGLAEILKMAIICDRKLFELLEQYGEVGLGQHFAEDTVTREIIHRAIIRMVEELYPNLYESNLERLVDFGHTFSPRIEVKSKYKIRHGEAVAIDMAISCRVACLLGYLTTEEYERIVRLYMKIGLPFFNEQTCDAKDLWDSLIEIYLHRGMKLNFIVPLTIGAADFIKEKEDIGFSVLQQAVSDLRNLFKEYRMIKFGGN
jgi:2-epi-5-epi-valiolone synthase